MNKPYTRIVKSITFFSGITAAALGALLIAVWAITFHPAEIQPAPVACTGKTRVLAAGQTVKILSWNVQYMAGKDHWFFYEGGTETAPTAADVGQTLDKVARIIKTENADIVLLQEIDENAKRTHYTDQLQRLIDRLPGLYPCRTEAFYWKSGFVPHPDVMGAAGMKLVILSKYKIHAAKRYQLPLIPENWVSQQFNLKRALLEARIAFNGHEFVVMNTHLSAFAQGTDTMEKQVAAVKSIMADHSANNRPWVAGGDFNLLPPGNAYQHLRPAEQSDYRPETEIKPLFDAFNAVPGKADVNSDARQQWFTHFPNDPDIKAPDKTIDYIFYPDKLERNSARVRQSDTLDISDHLPVVAEFVLPGKAAEKT